MFLYRNMENYLQNIPVTSLGLSYLMHYIWKELITELNSRDQNYLYLNKELFHKIPVRFFIKCLKIKEIVQKLNAILTKQRKASNCLLEKHFCIQLLQITHNKMKGQNLCFYVVLKYSLLSELNQVSAWPSGKGCSRNVRVPPWEGTFFSTPLPIINNFHLTLPPTITHFIVLRRPIFLFIRSTTRKQQ